MSLSYHLVVPDLFLPQQLAAAACDGLVIPALEKLLARAQPQSLPAATLEDWLCKSFGVAGQAIAPITLLADGMQPDTAYWLRADPVHIQMQRDQMILRPDVPVTADEAAQLCDSLNAHFAADGLRFISPHSQRWYLQLDAAPNIVTRPVAQAAGRNVHAHLPHGADALRWNGVFNEIQMLCHEHPVNQAREARGELSINSLWLWGGGHATTQLAQPYSRVDGDSPLAGAFAQAAGIPCATDNFTVAEGGGEVLLVWEGLRHALHQGDLTAWRDAVHRLEQSCAAPLWQALCSGRIARLTLDVPNAGGTHRFVLTRSAMWKVWRLPRSLMHYALV